MCSHQGRLYNETESQVALERQILFRWGGSEGKALRQKDKVWMRVVLKNKLALFLKARLFAQRKTEIQSNSRATCTFNKGLHISWFNCKSQPLLRVGYYSLDQEFSWLQIIRWVALALPSWHYIIVELLAHRLASNLLVFIICLKKERERKERKRIIYIS